MRWTSKPSSAGVPPARRTRIIATWVVIAIGAILACAILLAGAPPDKRLAVYSVAANYSLPLVQREGRAYVGLLEVLEPLGKVSAKSEGKGWRLHYNNVDGDFQVGKTRARVQGRDADLGGKFLVENNRGLVPVGSLPSLLPRFLGGPVTLHEDSGRLFIGSVATHFTASLSGDNPPRLVFHFSAPVNPMIATEPGALRMTFSREPVVAPASPTLTFGNKTIPSAIYSESNGAAVVTVNAAIPVIASFSNDGRTVTISATSASASAQNSAQNTTPPATGTATSSGQSTPAAANPPAAAPPVDAVISQSSTPATEATITEKLSATLSSKKTSLSRSLAACARNSKAAASRPWCFATLTRTCLSISERFLPTPIVPPSTSPCTPLPTVMACAFTLRCCHSATTIAALSGPGLPLSVLPCL